MSFAAEMRDFISAWTTINEMKNKKTQLDLQRQEIENLKEYRDNTLALEREKFDFSRSRAAAGSGAPAARARLNQEAQDAKKYEAVLSGIDASIQDEYAPDNYDNWFADLPETGGDGGTGDAWSESNPLEYELKADGGFVGSALPTKGYDSQAVYDYLKTVNPASVKQLARPSALAPTASPRPQPNPAAAPSAAAPSAAAPSAAAPSAAAPSAAAPSAAAPSAAAPSAASFEENYDWQGQGQGQGQGQTQFEPDPKAAAAVTEGARAAVSVAAPSLVEDSKKRPAAIGPDAESPRMNIITNEGGLSPDEWKQLVQTIDPNGSIPSYLQSAAVLSSTYQYFMEKGQPDKAAKVAKGILILNKQMTQTLGALAVNALDQGNTEVAARLLSDAANKFPTGQKFQVVPTTNGVAFRVMENGEVLQQGALTTNQFWQLAGKVRDGSLFIEEMGRLAEQGKQQRKVTPAQALELTANAQAKAVMAAEAFNEAVALNGTKQALPTEQLQALRDEAVNARKTYEKFFRNATAMGVKRTDINDAAEKAIAMSVDELPAAPEEGGGIMDRLKSLLMLHPLTATALATSTTNSKPATPQGNAANFDELPAPKTPEEAAKLPASVPYFVAPDGSVRRNPNYTGP